MNDFERINAPRVQKVLKMLDTIETSAKSNRAEDRMAQLLEPLRKRLSIEAAPSVDHPVSAAPPAPLDRDAFALQYNCSKAVSACEKVLAELKALHDHNRAQKAA